MRADHQAERDAFVEERRVVESAAVLAFLPSSPQTTSGSMSSGSSSEASSSTSSGSSLSAASVEYHHSSPIPMSPSQRLRTPRPASVGKKRVKTPLSRLVLEKAVRQKGKETATALELERLKGTVLGEGGRKGNEARVKMSASTAKTPALASSTMGKSTLKSGAHLHSSQARRSGPGEEKSSVVGRDLSKANGIGPKAAAKKVWR